MLWVLLEVVIAVAVFAGFVVWVFRSGAPTKPRGGLLEKKGDGFGHPHHADTQKKGDDRSHPLLEDPPTEEKEEKKQ